MTSATIMLASTQLTSLTENPKFVIPLSGKYVCTHCKSGLRPPVKQTACGHRLCDICLKELRSQKDSPLCPGKEEGCVPLTEDKIYPDRGTDRELYNMEVRCPNAPKCNATPTWRLVQKHIQNCKFQVIACPNAAYGCPVDLCQDELQNHLSQKCEYIPKLCQYCDRQFSGIQFMDHEKQCKEEKVPCTFEEFGCSFHGSRKDVFDHATSKETLAKHLEMTTKKLRMEEQKRSQITDQVETLRTMYQEQRQVLADVRNDLQMLSERIREDSNTNYPDSKKGTELSKAASNLQINEKWLEEIQGKLTKLEAHSAITEERYLSQSGVTEDETKIIKSNEKMAAAHDVLLAEHEIRFRCLETTNYNGVLLWKITSYQSRKRAAVEGRTLSIYSQPFYTDPYGYKMCARVYLDGDGMGKGTHASLYFVIMKGEYDSLLPWPFRQRVTMILMDQDTKRKHIRDTFRPDPTSTSFRRPATTMNIASGSPLFVSQSVLESSTYLRDDTVYIMIRVDLTDLNHFGLSH